MRSRLRVALALALALALVVTAGSLFGSAKPLVGATSPSLTAPADDDHGDGATAIAPQPLIVVAFLFTLALLAPRSSFAVGAASEPRRARGPPSR